MQRLWRVTGLALKWTRIALAGAFLVALLLFAVAWAINWRDEPLSAEARALLAAPPGTPRPDDNLYVAIAGLDAPAGGSVVAAGQARIDFYNRRVDAAPHDAMQAAFTALQEETRDPRRLEFKGTCGFLDPLNSSIWHTAPRHRAEIEKLLADNRELYGRYLGLHALHAYQETVRPAVPMPYFEWPDQLHKLFLGDVALRMRSPAPALQRQALADLEGDVRLWRTVFGGQGALLSKMIAAAYLQEDSLVFAAMIADPHVDLPVSDDDADAVAPVLPLEAWDIGSAFAAEFRMTASLLQQTDQNSANWIPDAAQGRAGRWLARLDAQLGAHFFKLDASENLAAQQTRRRMRAAADPAIFFRMDHAPREMPFDLRSAWVRLLMSYNPVGKILDAIADGAYDEYPPRVWDVAALQRLVRLGYEIRRQRIETAAVPQFLEQHPAWSTHPADGRRFVWDPGARTLRVQTIGRQQPGRRFSIPVWQPPAG